MLLVSELVTRRLRKALTGICALSFSHWLATTREVHLHLCQPESLENDHPKLNIRRMRGLRTTSGERQNLESSEVRLFEYIDLKVLSPG